MSAIPTSEPDDPAVTGAAEPTQSGGRSQQPSQLPSQQPSQPGVPERDAPVPGTGGEQFNAGPPTTPRQAAAVILLRDAEGGPEVLLVQRTPKAKFMGGVWVFPGGAVRLSSPASRPEPDSAVGAGAPLQEGGESHRDAARRELLEEAGVDVTDPASLVLFARWITPARVLMRFDTRFYLAALPAGASPKVDGEECVELSWFTPADALAAHGDGRIALVFPTVKQLEGLSSFGSVDAALEDARGQDVQPIEPRIVLSAGEGRIVLPGEPGYAEA